MMASAVWSTHRNGWLEPYASLRVAILLAAGGMTGWLFTVFATRLLLARRARSARYAFAFLTLAIMTMAATAGFYALWYRTYYAQWHASPLSIEWAFQFGFTTAGAVYQFLVLGLRLYFPLGLIALFVAALDPSRRVPHRRA